MSCRHFSFQVIIDDTDFSLPPVRSDKIAPPAPLWRAWRGIWMSPSLY